MGGWWWLATIAMAGGHDAFDALDGWEADPGLPGPDGGPQGIVNGEDVPDGELPNVVAMAADGPGGIQVYCSGSLIQRTWVLTAAHCIQGMPGGNNYVLFGSNVNSGGHELLVDVVQAIPFSGYSPAEFRHDLGLLELSEPVFDVPLMVLNDEPLTDDWLGVELLYAGFGLTSDGGSGVGVKRRAIIPITGYDGDNVIAFDEESNVCNGDSGGPSTRDVGTHVEQVGINAYVTPGCVGGESGSTDVSSYLDFILEHVPDVLFEPPPEGSSESGGPTGAGFDLGLRDDLRGPGPGMRYPARNGPGAKQVCATASGTAAPWVLFVLALAQIRRRTIT